ncbi:MULTISPECIES: hypothetical protein [Metabacillus]|uniref:hypothetical protein n=1 Tax=Metabacillus TaxID=2675233 RepID=UPI000C804AF4|nr:MULTISPECIES: hypothetical protein [Metabacillus]MCM3443985.1 hypothetical protein [Metabacillus halosaccharovorans]PMC34962.1 hypothetical protein CJ195_20870 [Bacillus sp. UMB0899]
MTQITFFDPQVEPDNRLVKEQNKPLKLNQLVQVKLPIESNTNLEDYYYILQFKSKKGNISYIHNGKVLSYSVLFEGNKEGIFYHDDLISL